MSHEPNGGQERPDLLPSYFRNIAAKISTFSRSDVCVRDWPEQALSPNPYCGAMIPPAEWELRPHQKGLWRAMITHGMKRAVYVAHRRAGKDDIGLHIMAQKAWSAIGNYWYMLPEAEHARKVIWDAVNPKTEKRRIDEAFPPGYRRRIRENEMTILNKRGSVIQLVGSDNYNRYVGSPPIGVVMSEGALSDPAAWAYISPILEENNGWFIVNGTPRGMNHFRLFYELACSDPERWYCSYITARDTDIFSEEQLKLILLENQKLYGELMGRALFRQEYLCDWSAPNVGSVYGDLVSEAEARILPRLPVEGISLVHTAWDIGGTTAIWFYQIVGPDVRVIDYYQQTGPGLDHYAEVLARKNYKYGMHNFPFDVKSGDGIDRVSILENLGVHVNALPQTKSIEDSIAAARAIFPRCYFDGKKCESGIGALRDYHKAWDPKLKCLSIRPIHDWSSHGAAAFEIMARATGVFQGSSLWKLPDYGIV